MGCDRPRNSGICVDEVNDGRDAHMLETALNALAQQLLDLTLCKSRYDLTDIQWYTEGPFWRRTSMRFSREYKILPDYEIGDMKHGKTLEDILDEAGRLIAGLNLYKKTAAPGETKRVDYLIEHTENLYTRTSLLLGGRYSYNEITDKLYGLTAPDYDYKKFDSIVSDLASALPGSGSQQDKIWRFRDSVTVPPEKLLKVLTDCTVWFHEQAVKHMTLSGNSMPRVRVRQYPNPNMEFLSILFGYDYNHIEYERNFNLNYTWTADHVTECICHEMEPGHLTYYEKRTQAMIDTLWPEMAVVSQYSSSSAFTEGSARHAISLCFERSMEKQADFEREYILKNAGLDESLADVLPIWHQYVDIAGYGKLEATRNYHDNVWTRTETYNFLMKYAFIGKEADESCVDQFMQDPGHFVSHDFARDVVCDYFDAYTTDTAGQWRLYEDLCGGHMSMRDMQKAYKGG